jgi:hypothetical protein
LNIEIKNKNTQIEKLSLDLYKTKELLSKLSEVKNFLNQNFIENNQNRYLILFYLIEFYYF